MSEILRDALEKWKGTVTEASEIVETVELVINRRIYRLEVLKNHGTGEFKGREIYEVRGLQYPKQADKDRIPVPIQPQIPWLNAPTAEFALSRAINWLVTGDV